MRTDEISRITRLLYKTKSGEREELIGMARSMLGTGGAIYTVNPMIMTGALDDGALYSALLRGVLIPDGVGVRIALSRLGIKSDTVAGVELGEALLDGGVRFAIIGGRAGRAELGAKNLEARHAPSKCVLSCDGYFTDDDAVIAQVLSCGAQVVFVCLGSPKQEIFIDKLIRAGGDALYIGLGGSVDIYSGKIRRAPAWVRSRGIEWAYRMLRQPKRLSGIPRLIKFMKISATSRKILMKSEKKLSKIAKSYANI